MAFELPELPYAYDALEPYIDARTMEIHHTKHHAAYVNKLNSALETYPDLLQIPLEGLVRNPSALPEDVRTAVRNHGGGHYNHSIFWRLMTPNGGGEPSGELGRVITHAFGSVSTFRSSFETAATSLFGSGWTWLGWKDGGLTLLNMPNQDAPLTVGLAPILAIDLWEHAYYLKYQNRRLDYITNWWNVVNWDEVARRLEEIRS